MALENVEQTVLDLQTATQGIKMEILDIKEILADYNNKIGDFSSEINGVKSSISQRLSYYITGSEVSEDYYNKSEINSKFEELDLITYKDIERYVISGGYITLDSLKGYVTLNSMSNFVENTLNDYSTTKSNDEKYATKEDLLKISTGDVDIDLSSFVTYNYLESKYPTRTEVIQMIPSTSGLVKKSELYSLISLGDYALTDWVNNNFVKKGEISLKNYVTKTELSEILSTNDFVEKSTVDSMLSKYATVVSLNNGLANLSNTFTAYVPEVLSTLILNNNLTSKDYVDKTFVTKSEWNSFVGSSTGGNTETNFSDFVKKSDLSVYSLKSDLKDYMTTKEITNELNSISTVIKAINTSLQKYVTKDEIKGWGDTTIINPDINLDDYVTKFDLSKYSLKSDLNRYVTSDELLNELVIINDSVKAVTNSFKNYVSSSQLSNYIRKDEIDEYLTPTDNFVTKSYLDNELAKIKNSNNQNTNNSGYLTQADYDKLKSYVISSLKNYTLYSEVYDKNFIDKYYLQKSDIEEAFYSKNDINKKFITKVSADETYMLKSEAYGKFLSREDYRGIKDAMTLNSAYNNSPDIFDFMIKNSKILDGFYIVNNKIVVVKDNVVYETPLQESGVYSKRESDERFVTKEYLEKEHSCNNDWIMDKGGNY